VGPASTGGFKIARKRRGSLGDDHEDKALMAPRVAVSIGEWVTLTADRFPDRPCFVYADGGSHTFAAINARVNRLADALRRNGVGQGDRVAVMALDSHRYAETVLAALKIGATYMPFNWRLSAQEVANLLDRGSPAAIFHSHRYGPMFAGSNTARLLIDYDGPEGGSKEYEDLLDTGSEAEQASAVPDDELFGLAFTSGTTGMPKGVLQSRRMMKHMVMSGLAEFPAHAGDVRYCASPMFHVTGVDMILMGIVRGFTSLVTPQFDPDATARFLMGDGLSACFLVPTMISMLLQRPELAGRRYDRLELIMYGAAPMSPALLRRAMDTFGCDFANLFGAGTEAGLQTLLTVDDHRRAAAGEEKLLGSIGRPATGIAVRLTDEDMNDVAIGQVGEITSRSDMVMDGYLDMPEQTARSLRDGWFRAGDLAYRDAEGYLYLAGRKNDMIIRGGENVYPVEIESVLAEHPSVALVSVVGVPDEHWGEVIRAWLVLRTGQATTPEELSAFCRSRLAAYKVPVDYRIVDELPMNASGKILKTELRVRA
jgi:acyl-CoA synthetase (AMP-forming)/AMP-acid ligase II